MSAPPYVDVLAALLLLLAGAAAALSGWRLGPAIERRCPTCGLTFEDCRCGSERP